MTRREFRSLSSPDAVREAIESLTLAVGSEQVPLDEAHDRVLATRVDADIDVPGFDRAAMDGYAVVASDTFEASDTTPVEAAVTGTIHAGAEPTVSVEPGVAAEIATGAVMPEGANAVIPVEETRETADGVEILSPVTPGEHVMARGVDIAAGDRTLGPGTRLGPRHLGLLAALGRSTVTVRSRPRVGIVSTGDELVQPGDSLSPRSGQIYDVNSHSIGGAVTAAGGEPRRYETVTDDADAFRETLARAASECSLLVTSGSTSAGSRDLLFELIEQEGETLVHGVALKPGRPMLVGRIFETPYVGLPGYPVSALTVFRTFVAPALRNATGRPEPADAILDATLRTRVRYDGGRLRLLSVGLVEDGDGSLLAYETAKGSGATTTLGEADGVVRMDPEQSLLSPGETVQVERFDARDPLPSLLGVGEPDPLLFELLDALPTPRYLTLDPTAATRWAEDEIPDVRVIAGSADEPADEAMAHETELGSWTREWGIVVPTGNPAGVDELAALDQLDGTVATLSEQLALGRECTRRDAVNTDSDGDQSAVHYRTLPGLESAARAVAAGRAQAGIGLRATAATLDVEFVPVDTQSVAVRADSRRTAKPAVQTLATLLDDLDERLASLPGYAVSGAEDA